MKRNIIVAILAVLFAASNLLAAPKLPDKCEAFRPTALTTTFLHEKDALALANSKDFGQNTPPPVTNYWIVFSDRANNQTYEEPSTSSATFSTLKWNEKLRIAKIQNGMALVYDEPKLGSVYPEISSLAKCRGWVPMKNLLLWQSCLANDAGIYNKALLCFNLDEKDQTSKEMGFGYLRPSEQAEKKQLATDMNFYFVMKEENGMVLLATQSKMVGTTSDENLLCWVPKPSYVPWSQRSCLEPTWKHEDAEYFADKQIEVTVYQSNRMDPNERAGGVPFTRKEYVLNSQSQYIYRMDGDQLRYPILDGTNDKLYSLSTFTTPDGKIGGAGKREKTPKEKADSIQEAKLIKKQNINLAVVIDGTRSMGKYYEPVKKALLEATDYFGTAYKLKVGIVIYRDYDDERDGGLVNLMPMTSVRNADRIEEFLDNGGTYGIKSHPKDLTEEEALFYGINTALEELSFPEGESNMMLVVGDCGNDAEDKRAPTRQELEAKLVAKDIHLMGFQVRNQSNPAFGSFNNQMAAMMRNSIQANYDKITTDSVNRVKVRRVTDRDAQNMAIGFGYENPRENEPQLYIGRYRNADPNVNGGEMDVDNLALLLQSAIADFSRTVQEQIDVIRRSAEDAIAQGFLGSGKTATMNISQSYMIKQLGEDWAKLMMESGAMVTFKGYAYKEHTSGREFFKPIIFISDAEFQELLKRLQPVAQLARDPNSRDRTPYINAMKMLIRSLAPGITDQDMDNLNNNDITALIGGLHESAEALTSYTLEDLSDPLVIDAAKYYSILRDFDTKFKRLRNIRMNTRYEYVKQFNGEKYYWIPIEDLP